MRYSPGVCDTHDHTVPVCPACCYTDAGGRCDCDCHTFPDAGHVEGYGLRRTGPNPWDFEYTPVKGQRIAVKLADGSLRTGTVTDFSEDEETGEIDLTVQQFSDALSWFDAVHDHCYEGDE